MLALNLIIERKLEHASIQSLITVSSCCVRARVRLLAMMARVQRLCVIITISSSSPLFGLPLLAHDAFPPFSPSLPSSGAVARDGSHRRITIQIETQDT
uniref:Uncharacterized protein n=1 Tax=Steinernema glaseri TaxID=37863 RepID=A0A1I8A9R0_9BILA